MEQQSDAATDLPLPRIHTALHRARTDSTRTGAFSHRLSPRTHLRIHRTAVKDTTQVVVEIYLRRDELTPDSILKQSQTKIADSTTHAAIDDAALDRLDDVITAASELSVLEPVALSLRGILLGMYGDTITTTRDSRGNAEFPAQFLCRCEITRDGELESTGKQFTSGTSPFDAGAYVFTVFAPSRVPPDAVPQSVKRR